jgi:hypothetical protein
MRLDLAEAVQKGDTLYNCFREPLVVADKEMVRCNNGHISSINFHVVNTGLQALLYDCEDLYFYDLEDEDDAERSWINWAKNNKDFFDTFDHIETIKEIYRIGFYDGFEHQKYTSYLKEMQK